MLSYKLQRRADWYSSIFQSKWIISGYLGFRNDNQSVQIPVFKDNILFFM